MQETNVLPPASTTAPVVVPVPNRPASPVTLPTRLGAEYAWRQIRTAAPLVMVDLTVVLLASLLISWFAPAVSWFGLGLPTALGILLTNLAAGLYPAIALHPAEELKRYSGATTATTLAVLAAATALQGFSSATCGFLLALGTILLPLLPTARAGVRHALAGSEAWTQPVLIFGGGPAGAAAYRTLMANRTCGLRPLGIVDDASTQWLDDSTEPSWYVATPNQATEVVRENQVYWALVVAQQSERGGDQADLSALARLAPHRLLVPEATNEFHIGDQVSSIGSMRLLRQTDLALLPGPRLIKRALDYMLIIASLPVFLPLYFLIGCVVRITSPGPLLFVSTRIGREGRTFDTLKFRTMRKDAAEVLQQYLDEHPEMRREWEEIQKLTNDPRITPAGGFLRKSSLDELPQLINVLKGDMSLVGPRPIVDNEIERYADRFSLYRKVAPGITGLWQVSGRNNTTYGERIGHDVFYVQNWSPWLDLYILARTIKVVLLREGAY